MSLPATEPIKETLKNLKMNIPLMEDKELLANSKYLRVNWRRWNMRSNFLQLYLYKEERSNCWQILLYLSRQTSQNKANN